MKSIEKSFNRKKTDIFTLKILVKKYILYCFLTLAILFSNSIYAQNIFYVKHDALGLEDGTSWTNAFIDLQSALDISASGDSVWVAAGTYKPTVDATGNASPSDERTKTFLMVDGVALIGGFAGNETNFTQRDIEANETILSGDIGIVNDTSDNAYHVITGSDNYSINGLTITKGNANVIDNNQSIGAGLKNDAVSNISIESCRFIQNYAFAGAGIANNWCTGSIEIKNCWFIADTAYNLSDNSGEGGAIGNWNVAPAITNCIFIDNYAYTRGGAIYNWGSGSTTPIANSTFYNNATAGTGGAVHNRGVSTTMVNSILWNNNSDDFTGTNGGGLTINYSCIEDITGYSGSNNINTNPLFFDVDNNDFDLQANSLCIDAGNGDEAPESDIYGNPRFDIFDIIDSGTGTITYTDIGAVECQGYPEISGHITQDTTWTHRRIQITSDLTVDDGATLTINPGTKIEFTGYYKLIVNGVILAEGTETDSIIFTTNDPATGYHGIRFESNTSTDSSKFAYCKFEYGKATGTSYEASGGAIYSFGFDLISIENCSFYNNTASGGGAIYLRDGASPVIRNNKFINNQASDGGAIYFEWQSTAQVINNLFANNSGSRGGAMVISNSDIILTNNTIVNNTASTEGGAIWFHNSDGSDISIFKNCIIFGNTATNGNQFSLDAGADPDIYNCNIEGGSAGFYGGPYGGTYSNNIDTGPVFTDPNTGVGNQADAWSSDWTLQGTSPCINTGLADTTGLNLPLSDIIGNPRVINNIIDMGAYESKVVPACGNISSNTTWDADTVKVNCDITIDDTYTLTIDPGTVIEFQGYYSITVNGCLNAEGTAIDSIKFTVNDTTGFADTSIVDGGWGGIIFNNTAATNDSSKFDYCTFLFGKTPETSGTTNGGAIKIANSPKISITNSYFKNNMASGMYASGGAIDIQNTDNIQIANCTFVENMAKGPYFGGGGAINIATSSPNIYNSKFFNNVADSSSGGAIYIRDNSNPHLANNLFTNNYARYGGAVMFATNTDAAFYNNMVAYNESKIGGGIACYENSNPVFKNNIIGANVDSIGFSQVYIFDNASQPDFSFNNIQDGESGFDMPDTVTYTGNYTDNMNEDPMLVSPTAGAGIEYAGIDADWTLQADNPGINTGTPDTTGLNIPILDLAGETRIFNDVRIDMGAYEYRNNHPEINAQAFDVDENSANTTLVGTCVATDVDGDNYSFSIISGNTNNAFAIDNDGNITVNNSSELDYENVTGQKFDLTIQIEDDGVGTLQDEAVITINLQDVNDAPVMNADAFTIDENSTNGAIIGTVSGTDEDSPAQTLSYAITGGTYAANFAIDVATGELTVVDSTPLDYETNPVITLTVQVQDNGIGSLTGSNTITINLNDVNDKPVISNQQFSIDEQSDVGTSIGTVLATDADSPSQNLSYAIVSGNENTAFSIVSSTGELQINNKDSVNYELATSQVITVEVNDDGTGNLSNSAEITVNINNVNDNAPVFNDTTITFSEFASETTMIVEFETTDIDELGSFTYSIISGNDNNIFYLQNGNGNRLYFTSNGFSNYLDYETYPSFNLVVAVSDGDSISEANVTINIEDENESPVLEAFEFNLDENANVGSVVGTISGTDPDIGQNLYYFITSGAFNNVTPFALDSVTGVISVIDSTILNYEGFFPTFTLSIEIRDDGDPSISAYNNVTININDLNEAPIVDQQTYSLYENAVENNTIATVNYMHDDSGQSVSFEITGGNEDGIFAINPTNGVIFIANNDSLDYEKNPILEIIIKVTDDSDEHLSDTALITFNVQDVNEAPIVSDYTFTIDENTPFGEVIGTVEAIDPENDPVTYYFVTSNMYPPFNVNNTSGEIYISTSDSIDFEYRSQFVLTLAARDYTYNETYSIVTINLNDVNEAPIMQTNIFYIDENSPANTILGTTETITDAGETVGFSITNGNTYHVFDIDAGTGEIFVSNADTLNYELINYFELTVRATDDSPEELWGENVQVIHVQNVNEAPIINSQKIYYLKDPNVDPYVGTISATDEDDNILFYTIESGNFNNAFYIYEMGEIYVDNPEAINPNVTPTYELVVSAEDYELSDTALITIQLTPDGISHLDMNEIVNVFPNPVKEKLHFDFANIRSSVKIEIFDLKDQIMIAKEVNSNTKIDVSALASGLYIIRITDAGKYYYGKIVKE